MSSDPITNVILSIAWRRPLSDRRSWRDMLDIPPGMLHHVRSLDCALSFNVDWHTKDSALAGLIAARRGMPAKNVYFNAVIALGLWSGVPAKALLPYYRSYLDYVS